MRDHQELAVQLDQRPDLLVIESDPLSGASALLALAVADLDRKTISIDARASGDALDLAMAIASAAVRKFAPEALSWWNGTDIVDSEGLQLSRTLANRGIDLDGLRVGSGSGGDQLRHALEFVAEIGESHGLLAIDHVDDLLERLSAAAARELLGILRAELQRNGSVQQLLVGRTDGRLATSLRDSREPFYRGGNVLRLRRPKPGRFVDDLAVGRPWTTASAQLIGAAAELASGAPAFVWRVVSLAKAEPHQGREAAVAAWQRLREYSEPSAAQQFRLLAATQRAAPTVACAIALGVGPYELPLNPKTINDALTRMRARGQAYSPEKQRWALSDPLLAAWARDHAPVWVHRRSRGA